MVDDVSTPAADETGPTVQQVRLRLRLIGPVRIVLGVIWLVAAIVAGAPHRPALLGAVVSAVFVVFLAFNDPRRHFRRRPPEPRPLPATARVAPSWKHAVYAAFPSTVGVSILAIVSLPGRPVLSAVMGGILVGLGIVSLLTVGRTEPDLYMDPRTRVVFRK
jgi:hypothetical protein